MREKDLKVVLRWRNAEQVRRNMLDDHIISHEEHTSWFDRAKSDNSCEWLVGEYMGRPIGVVGITHIDWQNGTCTFSLYLSDEVGIPGMGAMLEMRAIDRMFEAHGVRKIWGEALKSNSGILALHRKFGFSEEGILRKHVARAGGFEDIVRVALFSERWAEIRVKFENGFSSAGRLESKT